MKLSPYLTTVTPFSKLIALILFLTIPIYAFIGGLKYQELRQDVESLKIACPIKTQTQTNSTGSASYKEFENTAIGYSLLYPGASTLIKGANIPSAYIEKYEIRIEPLDRALINKERLMMDDLFCGSAGPRSSSSCEITKIEDFTNAKGVKGFISHRIKTESSQGKETQYLLDRAYVFLTTHKTYTGVSLSTNDPVAANLKILDDIANSYTQL